MVSVSGVGRRGAHSWPPRPLFCFYDGWGRLLFSRKNARLDMADTLMLWWPRRSRVVTVGIASSGTSWPTWTEERLQHVENFIRYDLAFDGYTVSIERLTNRRWQPCSREFRWKLRIRG